MDFKLHSDLIKLAVAYTVLGAFIFTMIITCLGMIGVIKFKYSSQQKTLFQVLIVELGMGCIAFFLGYLNFNFVDVQKEIEAPMRGDANGLNESIASKQERIDTLEKQIDELIAKINSPGLINMVQKKEETALAKEAKTNISWAVLRDANRNNKYHRYKSIMSKYDAVLKAQSHNKHAQDTIKKFGAAKTIAYLHELGE